MAEDNLKTLSKRLAKLYIKALKAHEEVATAPPQRTGDAKKPRSKAHEHQGTLKHDVEEDAF